MVMTGGSSVPLAGARGRSRRGKREILVVIFQRGAADGSNVVVPFAEKRYYELRPTIGIPAPRASNGTEPSNRPGRPIRAESRAATAQGAMGQTETGDRGGHGFAGPDPLAL